MTVTIENVLAQLQDENLEFIQISTCDELATEHNNSTISLDSINQLEGTACNEIIIPSGQTGLIASFNLSDLYLDKYNKLRLSIYSDTALEDDDISIILSESEECRTILEELNNTSQDADYWYTKTIEFINPSDLIGLKSIGFQINKAFTEDVTLKVDNIRAYAEKFSTTRSDVESKISSATLKATNYLERTEAPISNPSFDDAVTEWAAGLVFNKIYDAQGQEAGSYHRGMALIRSAKETLDSMKGDPNQDGKTDTHFLLAVSTPDTG